MITGVFAAILVAAAPAGGVPGVAAPGTPGSIPPPPGVNVVQPGSTISQASQEPEIAAAEAALRAAEQRAREAQIEVSRRVSEVQEARMGMDLARAEVDLRKLKVSGKSSEDKSRIKALESRVSVLRGLIKEDLPAMRDLQARMLKAQTEDPASLSAVQTELMARQRIIARKQVELEIATLRSAGGDPERIKAMERRLEELKKQTPATPPGARPGQESGKNQKKGKS